MLTDHDSGFIYLHIILLKKRAKTKGKKFFLNESAGQLNDLYFSLNI